MRKETGDERYYAPMERNKISFTKRLEGILARPFKILFLEPMLIAITLYMSVRYLVPPRRQMTTANTTLSLSTAAFTYFSKLIPSSSPKATT